MDYIFTKPNVKVDIDFEKGSIASILYNNEELIHKAAPLFRVKFRDRDASYFWIDALKKRVNFDPLN